MDYKLVPYSEKGKIKKMVRDQLENMLLPPEDIDIAYKIGTQKLDGEIVREQKEPYPRFTSHPE